MARVAERGDSSVSGGATLDFERQLWATADALRGHMEAAEYKHVVLGLIFLKYISDAFAKRYEELEAEEAEGADPEDRDEYKAEGASGRRPTPAGRRSRLPPSASPEAGAGEPSKFHPAAKPSRTSERFPASPPSVPPHPPP